MTEGHDNYTGMTLEEYKTRILEPCVKQFMSKHADDIMAMHLNNLPLPTYLECCKYKWQDIKQRAKDIWTIVSGGDIHDDCGRY